MSSAIPDNKTKSIDQTLKIGIFQIEPFIDGNINFINNFGLKILGYTSNTNVIGQKFSKLFVEFNYYKYLMNSFLNDENFENEIEIKLKKQNDEHCDVKITGCLVKDFDGNNIRIDGTFRDISEEKNREEENEIVGNINKILVANLNMRKVYQKICDEIYRKIKWERVSVLLCEGITSDVAGVVDFAINTKSLKHGALREQFEEKKNHAMIGSILEKVVITKKPFIVNDTSKNILETDKYFDQDGLGSRFAYPLTIKNKIIGCIAFSTKPVDYFRDEHIRLVEKIAPFLSIAIENARIYFKATKTEKEYNDLFKTIDSPWV